MGLTIQQAKELADELSGLSKVQSETLETATYIKMTTQDAAHYDGRARRIKEICTLLGTYESL
jgi:hypothetical protein